MNSAPRSEDCKEKRPDVRLALDELEGSVTIMEELIEALSVKISPVCSDPGQAISATAESPQSVCQVSAAIRSLDQRAYVLTCRLRYLLSALEV